MQETWVQSLGWEDPLEERTATHSGVLAWRTPWAEEPGRIQSMGSQKSRTYLSSYNVGSLLYSKVDQVYTYPLFFTSVPI